MYQEISNAFQKLFTSNELNVLYKRPTPELGRYLNMIIQNYDPSESIVRCISTEIKGSKYADYLHLVVTSDDIKTINPVTHKPFKDAFSYTSLFTDDGENHICVLISSKVFELESKRSIAIILDVLDKVIEVVSNTLSCKYRGILNEFNCLIYRNASLLISIDILESVLGDDQFIENAIIDYFDGKRKAHEYTILPNKENLKIIKDILLDYDIYMLLDKFELIKYISSGNLKMFKITRRRREDEDKRKEEEKYHE